MGDTYGVTYICIRLSNLRRTRNCLLTYLAGMPCGSLGHLMQGEDFRDVPFLCTTHKDRLKCCSEELKLSCCPHSLVRWEKSFGKMSLSGGSDKEVERAKVKDNSAYLKLTFPAKLHTILSIPENQDIISWLPHGRSWRILRQEQFEEQVLPMFFRHARHKSFIRQVNGWGFKRITSGPDYNSYYHEHFLRGRLDLCQQMQRLRKEDIDARKQADPESPPNFYAMPPVSARRTTQDESAPQDPAPGARAAAGSVSASASLQASSSHSISASPLIPTLRSIQHLPPHRELILLDELRTTILNQLHILSGSSMSRERRDLVQFHQRLHVQHDNPSSRSKTASRNDQQRTKGGR
eukprot:scaffold25464_cov113-Cylindrotheca_fusiformis.AAC.1